MSYLRIKRSLRITLLKQVMLLKAIRGLDIRLKVNLLK